MWSVQAALVPDLFEPLGGASGDLVVVAGQPPGSALYALQVLDRATGRLLWSTAPRKDFSGWRLDRGDLFELSATHLHRYDARSGERRWSIEVSRAGEDARDASVWLGEREVVVIGRMGELRISREGGERRAVEPASTGVCVVNGAVVEVPAALAEARLEGTCGRHGGRVILPLGMGTGGLLAAIDPATSTVVWSTATEALLEDDDMRRQDFQDEAPSWPARRPFRTSRGLVVADLETGHVSPPAREAEARLMVTGGVALYVWDGLLAAFEPATGKVERAIGITEVRGHPVRVRDGRVLLVDRDAWRVLDAATLAPVDAGAPLPDRTADARQRLE